MNTAAQAAQTAVTTLSREVKNLKVTDRDTLRRALILKHGSLTVAAENLNIPYVRLSAIINGREYTISQVAEIQSDLNLTDSQVLHLWPLLKSWPRKSRVVS